MAVKSRMSSSVLEGIFCRPLAMEKGGVLRMVLRRAVAVVRVRASQQEELHWEGSVRDLC